MAVWASKQQLWWFVEHRQACVQPLSARVGAAILHALKRPKAVSPPPPCPPHNVIHLFILGTAKGKLELTMRFLGSPPAMWSFLFWEVPPVHLSWHVQHCCMPSSSPPVHSDPVGRPNPVPVCLIPLAPPSIDTCTFPAFLRLLPHMRDTYPV